MPLKVASRWTRSGPSTSMPTARSASPKRAQARGHSLFFCYTPDHLSYQEGRVMARGQDLTVRREQGNQRHPGPRCRELDLPEMDVVWLRQDPPFDMGYITTHPYPSTGSIPARWWSNDPFLGPQLSRKAAGPWTSPTSPPRPPSPATWPPCAPSATGTAGHHPQAALRQWRRRGLQAAGRGRQPGKPAREMFTSIQPRAADRCRNSCPRSARGDKRVYPGRRRYRSAPSTGCRKRARPARTCMSAGAPRKPP